MDESEILEKTVKVYFKVNFEYAHMDKVMRIIKENNLEIKHQRMELDCEYIISVRKKYSEKIDRLFTDLRCLKIKEVKL